MQTKKTMLALLSAVLVAAVGTSSALAGTCVTNNRTFPGAAGQDALDMSCRKSGTATTALVIAQNSGSKTLRAFLQGGQNAASVFARAQGLDGSGNVLAGCTSTDAAPVDGSAGPLVTCAAAVLWRGTIGFPN